MPIIIIDVDERLTYEWDSTTKIYYRRIPAAKRAELLQKHTTFGQLNDLACQIELCEYAIIGWDGEVYNQHGVRIPYSPEAVATLPSVVFGRLMGLVVEAGPEQLIKNFRGQLKDGLS